MMLDEPFGSSADEDLLRGRVDRRLVMVVLLLLLSLLLLTIGTMGARWTLSSVVEEDSQKLREALLQDRMDAVERFLDEQERTLDLLARQYSLEEIGRQEVLEQVFADLSDVQRDCVVDLGVVDDTGLHRAYVGDHDLIGRNYANAPWFHRVMEEGTFVSDVFMGLRQEPHCIVAVRQGEGRDGWVLRATIDSATLEDLVRGEAPFRGAEAFLIDRTGRLQTPSRDGAVLQPSGVEMAPHGSVHHRVVTVGGASLEQSTAWVHDDQWLLVVQQEEGDIQAPVRRAAIWDDSLLLMAVLVILLTLVLSTRQWTSRPFPTAGGTPAVTAERRRSMQMECLAELSAGLAHQINKPLAIISAEQTNVRDLVLEALEPGEERDEVLRSVEGIQREVGRCGEVTAEMLRFGRASDVQPSPVEPGPVVQEVARLMRNRAQRRNVSLQVDVEAGAPWIRVVPKELQQVLMHLVDNALSAVREGGEIRLSMRTEGGAVVVRVRDDGCGIPPENLERIFQPFFSTQPSGRGVGLGLSVCYGLVRRWGGTIGVESQLGEGADFTIRIPPSRSAANRPDPGQEGSP